MKTPYEVIIVAIIFTVLMSFTAFVGLKVIEPGGVDNERLSDESKKYILGLENKTASQAKFEQASVDSNVSGSFQDTEPEVRQYLESKSEASKLREVVTTFSTLPDLIGYTIGINNSVTAKILGWLVVITGLIIVLVTIRLFFGGGKITKY